MELKINNKKDFYSVAMVMLVIYLLTLVPFAPPFDELVETTGTVEHVYKSSSKPFKGNYVKIDSSSSIDEFSVDSTCDLSMIKKGDFIKAKVQRDILGRDIYWVWDLNVNDKNLLTYEQSVERTESDIAPIRWAAIAMFLGCGVIGALVKR